MFGLIRGFWNILERRERNRVLLTIAVLLVSSLVQILGVGSILPFMTVLTAPDIIQRNHYLHMLYTHLGFTSETPFLFMLGLFSLAAVFLSNACLALNQWISVRLSAAIQHRLEVRLLEEYMNAPYLLHLQRSPAELKRNILDETLRFSGIGKLALQLLASVFLILCVTGILLVVNPVLTLILGALIGGGYGLVYLVVRRGIAGIGSLRLEANLQRYKMVDEGLSGLKELRILQRNSWVMRRYTKAIETLTATLARQSVLGTIPRYFIEVIGFGGMLVVILYLLATDGDVRAATPLMSVFAFGAYRMMPAMQGTYSSIMGLRFYAPVARAMEEELRPLVHRKNLDEGYINDEAPLDFGEAVDLCDISFRYSPDREWVFRGLRLRIPYGSFIGVAGETGSGKSTLADLVLGLIPPYTGVILVDGQELKGNLIKCWQRLLGYVPQDIYLADDTIENNIAFGLPSEQINEDGVREAARLAQINRFIEDELPKGYKTHVGDRGVRLSGGQRQRIGIARALYHNPKILILDEATSMLDGETEARVFSAIESLGGDITLFVIAHRLSTLQGADIIYFLENGTISDQGTLDELVASNDRFRKMAHSFA